MGSAITSGYNAFIPRIWIGGADDYGYVLRVIGVISDTDVRQLSLQRNLLGYSDPASARPRPASPLLRVEAIQGGAGRRERQSYRSNRSLGGLVLLSSVLGLGFGFRALFTESQEGSEELVLERILPGAS
ncbi:hypothetical protein B296_00011150 [Ensete ventricosum]|uniref:Uncharacterized protein n=1 Tax=Ensete ventricosum TaxID=4639 RepID=A0A427B6M0_ENSVE|nr:hypothetical protein B296_00011150 [Ensete ventricosum]